LIVCGALLTVGGIACGFFPLFHIRPLGGGKTVTGDQAAPPRKSGPADPAAYVRDFWDGSLRRGDVGTDIAQLWDAFDVDASKSRSQYGRQAGLGGAWYFCISGQGTVETVEKTRVVLRVANSPRRACLELGVLVDNTVREAVGVKASEFANSQDFNAVSSELNRRVEQDVIAANQSLLKPGVIVDFVGCAKISRDEDLDPLCLIPIRLEVQGNEDRDAGSTENADRGAPP
jgi:predicted lipoprotein